MFDWIFQNLGTIATGLVVACIIGAIIVKIVRDKRIGKCAGCDCGCENCPGASDRGTKW